MLVSIHDVTPHFASEVNTILDWALRVGIRPALLVVPEYHGEYQLHRDSSFCQMLRQAQTSGHEILLHGYYHDCRTLQACSETDSSGGGSRGLRGATDWARTQFYDHIVSAGEAEFGQLSGPQAEELLDRGERALETCGLTIDGFVAPAWVMPQWLRSLVAKRRWHFTEDHLRVYEPCARKSRLSVLINFATRSNLRLAATVVASRVGQLAPNSALVRVAIHPADLHALVLQRRIRRLLQWAARRGVVTTRRVFA